MKPPLSLLAFVCAGAPLAVIAAENNAAIVSATFVDPDSPEVAEIRTLGDRAISRLAMTLVNEVTVAVNKGGPEKAIDVCHLKALPITNGTVAGLPRIKAVKRTSLKLRNPQNAPDAAEQLALQRVEKDIDAGVLPKVLVQRIDLPDGSKEWRVYRPVGAAPQCITCHGARDALSPELRALLAERYPKDEAVGYSAGQWRGLIRVTVADAPPAAASPAPKKKI